uniref:ATP synthase subunit a n=1 Tax=Macridiscus melanaegis TaxID=900990 RepID=A0A6C0RUE6_9BIVA|nr:ATP synthase F0 subunit 6 [Macridiscus melanaegis]QIA44494.1 ATP synthase subunit 6 [Macridiscus melanaegis]QUA05883.1 ATP synthase F0 subunit 6 [Macridiscus melanaegis]
MTGDLFSMFDCGVGGSGFLSSCSVWVAGVLVVMLIFCHTVYLYSISDVEVVMFSLLEEIVKMVPEKAKVLSGLGHIVSSLLLVLLPMCVVGYLPMSFSLGAQAFVTTSLSFPFFLMTVGVGFTPNWYLGLVKMVYDGSPFLIKFLVVLSELVGMLLRPFTLAIRMSLNLAVGSVMLKIFSSLSVGLLLPFTYSIFSLGGPVIVGMAFGLFSALFSFFELCMAFLQSMIFTMLIVSYCGDLLIKPE